MRVQLFVTCLVDSLYPEVGERTVALLERLGCTVEVPAGQTCCGQPAANSGYPDPARRVARRFLEAFSEDAPIVAPFGSCVHMVRHQYPRLFASDAGALARARALGAQTYELASFVVDRLGHETVGGRYPLADGGSTPVAWHPECHLLRGLNGGAAPRRLLDGVERITLVEPAASTACCGFGGTFAIKLSEVSVAMADAKLDAALGAGARAIVSTDPGCLMHLEGRARHRGLDLAVHHLVDLLEPDGRLS
jgi:L-lactate dehydrogenase complex protein LldE